MIKKYFMKKMIERQLRDIPKEEQERVSALIEKNPEFFMQIARELEDETKNGKSQQEALMTLMQRHGDTLNNLLKE